MACNQQRSTPARKGTLFLFPVFLSVVVCKYCLSCPYQRHKRNRKDEDREGETDFKILLSKGLNHDNNIEIEGEYEDLQLSEFFIFSVVVAVWVVLASSFIITVLLPRNEGQSWLMLAVWSRWCTEKKESDNFDDDGKQETATAQSSSESESVKYTLAPTRNLDDRSDRPDPSIWDHIYWKRPVTLFEDILTMGVCLSRGTSGNLIENVDGNEKEFHARYIEDRVLGEGEFGVVKLVHDMTATDQNNNTMACKVLRKGVVFKDNTLYAPLKPEVLQAEVDMLRALNGEHYCMKLNSVYETIRSIYVITEFCAGGEMQEYVSKQEEDLRTDDVSRIAFQMLDAINHCAQHNIIHRDIKPENVMFKDPTPGSDLRLIDFGSGTNKVVEDVHTTFAGSAFYISPEMFQRTYTQKTDVWSVGVTLYVLVAGYPADNLQKTFNKLQTVNRNLRDLPNFPEDLPDSFYDMLEGLLVYKHKKRKTAAEMLTHEFVQFHKAAFDIEQIVMEAQQEAAEEALKEAAPKKKRHGRTQSISLKGSVGRHSLFLDYQKFERSLTTLMATLLGKEDLKKLLDAMEESISKKKNEQEEGALVDAKHKGSLDVVKIIELKSILEELRQDQVLAMIEKLPGSAGYKNFAYDVALLKEFVREPESVDVTSATSSARHRRRSGIGGSLRGGSLRGSFRKLRKKKERGQNLDSSIHSVGSLRGRKGVNASITGAGNVFNEIKAADLNNPRRMGDLKGKSDSNLSR